MTDERKMTDAEKILFLYGFLLAMKGVVKPDYKDSIDWVLEHILEMPRPELV